MRPLRRLALASHITAYVGWLGALAAFLALAITARTQESEQLVRSAWLAMGVIVLYVIVPLAFTSLLTGLVSSLATEWGLFRHYWVVVKFVLTCGALAVLLKQLAPLSDLTALAADPTAPIAELKTNGRALLHSAAGLVVLLGVQLLGVYKPAGLTRYGWRKRHEQRVT